MSCPSSRRRLSRSFLKNSRIFTSVSFTSEIKMDKSLTFYESMKYEEFIMGSGHNFIRPDFTTYVFPVSKSSQNSIADSYFTVRTSSAFHIHFSLHKKYMPIHTSGRILTAKKRFQNRITDLFLVYVSCLRPSRGLSFAGLPQCP